jgi:hypothetical protein
LREALDAALLVIEQQCHTHAGRVDRKADTKSQKNVHNNNKNSKYWGEMDGHLDEAVRQIPFWLQIRASNARSH